MYVCRRTYSSRRDHPAYPFYWLVTQPQNGTNGNVEGVEVAVTHNLDWLPGLWSGLGLGANYTFVANQVTQQPGATFACGLPGLSKNSFNLDGFYEKGPVQMRLAYNWRSSFLLICNGEQGAPEDQAAYGSLDFSASYQLTPSLQVYAEGSNVLGAATSEYSIYTERFLRYDDTGPRYQVGVRFKF